jgi:hypothetical protein
MTAFSFTYSSSHPHLAVHEHGQKPVAEGDELLVLLVVCEDQGVGFGHNFVKGVDDIFFAWICEL